MKKILLIGNCYLPIPAVEGGAIETLVNEYLKYSQKHKDLNFVVYSPFSKKTNYTKNKTYTNCEFRYINKKKIIYTIYRYLLALKRRIFKNKTFPTAYCIMIIKDLKKRKELNTYNLVIIENEIESIITYKKNIKSKIVEHLHNDYLNINTKNYKRIIDSCDEVWGVSKFITNRVNEITTNNKAKVLYNGIDTSYFSKKISNSEQSLLKKNLKIKKQDYVVLYVGRIMSEKGVLELIKSFNIAKEKNKNLKLLIVGGEKDNKKNTIEYMKIIDRESRKNKESIIFYGKATGKELLTLYSITDLQVIPSIWEEAFGLIAVEGICAAHPLIVTNSGGLTEIVNNDSAIIVNRDNIIEELSEAILKISSDNALATKLVTNASKVKRNFDYEKYNKRFDELIYNILEDKGSEL